MKKMYVLETDVLGAIDLSNPGSGFAGNESMVDFISDWQLANRKLDKKNSKTEKLDFTPEFMESFSKNYS